MLHAFIEKWNPRFCKCTVAEKNTEMFAVNQMPRLSTATTRRWRERSRFNTHVQTITAFLVIWNIYSFSLFGYAHQTGLLSPPPLVCSGHTRRASLILGVSTVLLGLGKALGIVPPAKCVSGKGHGGCHRYDQNKYTWILIIKWTCLHSSYRLYFISW